MVRAEFSDGPYWLRALRYSHAGCLQGTLDEYSHLLRESLGCNDDLASEMAEKIAAELIGSLTLRTTSLRVDEITVPPYARELKIKSESMHIRFAMRFGDEVTKMWRPMQQAHQVLLGKKGSGLLSIHRSGPLSLYQLR